MISGRKGTPHGQYGFNSILEKMFNNVYRDRNVLVTGAAGFKGTWLCLWLKQLGAKVAGYSLLPETEERMADVVHLREQIDALCVADIRDTNTLNPFFTEQQPEIVFHLAAQPLVRLSYSEPVLTYETNVMGTLKVLEAARATRSAHAFVNVTTDKCYENIEKEEGYKEDEPMGGYDMYSSSKGCSELLTSSYRRSFLQNGQPFALATARAGNVIGGGDWGCDRLIPDCIRSFRRGETVRLRNPYATRPWQHVLEPLHGYLRLGQKLLEEGTAYAEAFNFGPCVEKAERVCDVVSRVAELWGDSAKVEIVPSKLHEATLLQLDATKAAVRLGWHPALDINEAIRATVEWYTRYYEGHADMLAVTREQIKQFTQTL